MVVDTPIDLRPYVCWLHLGDDEWVRAFQTIDPDGAIPRMIDAWDYAGADEACVLPLGQHPAEQQHMGGM